MIVIIAICLCLIAFGYLLPIVAIVLSVACMVTGDGILLGVGVYKLWRMLCPSR